MANNNNSKNVRPSPPSEATKVSELFMRILEAIIKANFIFVAVLIITALLFHSLEDPSSSKAAAATSTNRDIVEKLLLIHLVKSVKLLRAICFLALGLALYTRFRNLLVMAGIGYYAISSAIGFSSLMFSVMKNTGAMLVSLQSSCKERAAVAIGCMVLTAFPALWCYVIVSVFRCVLQHR